MRLILLVILSLAALHSTACADARTNFVSTNDLLVIDRCFSSVAGGTCTLTIGPLRAAGDLYSGDYATKVSPYFFKNEDGRLSILITRHDIEKARAGRIVQITGTATENGKSRKTRRIDATATPLDGRQGTLRLHFLAGEREMVFNTRYKFVSPN